MATVVSRVEPYAGLNRYLSGRFADNIVLTFAEIEDLLGFALPAEAHVRTEWWLGGGEDDDPSPQRAAWTRANRTATPNLFARTVRFERDTVAQASTPPRPRDAHDPDSGSAASRGGASGCPRSRKAEQLVVGRRASLRHAHDRLGAEERQGHPVPAVAEREQLTRM